MIDHRRRVIFLHIPKCAGTSIERAFGVGPFNSREPDYEHLVGWCPKRGIFLQHATAQQLLEFGLVSPEVWSEYFTFTVVRNPFARAVSDYFWLRRLTAGRGSFREFLEESGAFTSILRNVGEQTYRGDHVKTQVSYITASGFAPLDFIGRVETLNDDMLSIADRIGIELPLANDKAQRQRFAHYSHMYADEEIAIVARKYAVDLETFGYELDDRRADVNPLVRKARRLRHRVGR
jgi:chondroitin 4-sulfotransferase 11